MKITLPFPPSSLMPNKARTMHWAGRGAAAKKYHTECFYAIKSQHIGKIEQGKTPLKITFHQPDKRGRDIDNMLAACKAGIDALSLALGVDDKLFRPVTLDDGDVVKGGMVVVEVLR